MADKDSGGGKAAPKSADKRAVDVWADARFPVDDKGRRPFDFWKHQAAAALHQWAQHAYHAAVPMELSEADYGSALEAACKPNPKPHKPALSKFAAGKDS